MDMWNDFTNLKCLNGTYQKANVGEINLQMESTAY